MGRFERKIERILTRAFFKAVVWVLLSPFKLLLWLFKVKQKREINSRGYVFLTEVEELEHRYIAMQLLGRKLHSDEVVHHINGLKTDNQIGNLCLMNKEKHEYFHSWLKWKKEKSGSYPNFKKQKNVLEKEYGGTLLENLNYLPESPNKETSKDKKQLLADLKGTRKTLASDNGVPLFMIFNNGTLDEMVEKLPTTEDEMLKIKGVGPVKMRKYGDSFLRNIKDFKKNTAS